MEKKNEKFLKVSSVNTFQCTDGEVFLSGVYYDKKFNEVPVTVIFDNIDILEWVNKTEIARKEKIRIDKLID